MTQTVLMTTKDVLTEFNMIGHTSPKICLKKLICNKLPSEISIIKSSIERLRVVNKNSAVGNYEKLWMIKQ